MTETLRPSTIPVCLLQCVVTEQGETSTQKVDLPRMVLPEELLPVPVLPRRTIVRGSASDVGGDASQTVTKVKQLKVYLITKSDTNQSISHSQYSLKVYL